ncbi:hypothetical protein NEOLEDRAFT_1167861 [Neolentinus lepideus HHB14362 ss-1]|uniref:C2H2-type domain-containing protein n=1 Tax=Neolentinus lepideus HHB14362 ss-1 TaxID=1314782 RepID=A0A165U782_9AGAM|nr:hypothetical protein NEOLEDRAFT_1167861 [Neolentinus lepideus HHB14362 ss-1]
MHRSAPSFTITLTPEAFADLAKSTVKPIKCEWDGCPATLNCWYLLHQHIDKQHCTRKSKNKAGSYECRFPRCTARSHGSTRDLLRHLESNHTSRYPLPCPIQGCEETFARQNYIPVHFRNNHAQLENMEATLYSPILKSTWLPLHPRPIKPLQPIPHIEIDHERLLAPTVISTPQKAGQQPGTASKPLSRTWSHLSVPDEKEKFTNSDEEPESMPFEDFLNLRIPTEEDDPEFELPEFIVRRKPPEQSVRQLSVLPPLLNFAAGCPELEHTPASIGFDAFQARYDELEKAGLISGTGVWPHDIPSRSASAVKGKRTDA